MNKNRGFVWTIIVIVIALIILAKLGVDFSGIMKYPIVSTVVGYAIDIFHALFRILIDMLRLGWEAIVAIWNFLAGLTQSK